MNIVRHLRHVRTPRTLRVPPRSTRLNPSVSAGQRDREDEEAVEWPTVTRIELRTTRSWKRGQNEQLLPSSSPPQIYTNHFRNHDHETRPRVSPLSVGTNLNSLSLISVRASWLFLTACLYFSWCRASTALSSSCSDVTSAWSRLFSSWNKRANQHRRSPSKKPAFRASGGWEQGLPQVGRSLGHFPHIILRQSGSVGKNDNERIGFGLDCTQSLSFLVHSNWETGASEWHSRSKNGEEGRKNILRAAVSRAVAHLARSSLSVTKRSRFEYKQYTNKERKSRKLHASDPTRWNESSKQKKNRVILTGLSRPLWSLVDKTIICLERSLESCCWIDWVKDAQKAGVTNWSLSGVCSQVAQLPVEHLQPESGKMKSTGVAHADSRLWRTAHQERHLHKQTSLTWYGRTPPTSGHPP